MDSIEMANFILGNKKSTKSITRSQATQTNTVTGVATSDSSNGTVMVDFGGDSLTYSDDQSVPVSTTTYIKKGDSVIVNLIGAAGTGKTPIVIGVVARGDEQQQLIEKAILGVDVEYALSDSETSAPTEGWSTVAPEWISGKYMWQRTKVLDGSGSSSYSNPTCISGAKGDTGTGVSSIVEQYYLSSSNTTQTGGSWSTTCPTWVSGYYIWTRSVVTWTTGSTTYTTPVLANGINSANETAKAVQTYFFHDSTGAHVTTVPGSYATGNNVLIDSDSLDIQNGTTVLASYTAARVDLGKNSRDATISFCDGYATIAFDNNGILQIKPDGDKCVMDFNQSILELQSGAPTGIVPSSMELGCNRYGESWCSWSATKLYFVWAAASKTVNITMKQLQGIVSPCFVIRYLVSETYSLATGTGNTIPTSVLNSIDNSGCFTNYTNYTRIKLSGYYELSATVRYNGVPQGTQVSVSVWDDANQQRYSEYTITQPTTNGNLIFGTTPQIFHLNAGCNLYFSARAGIDCTINGYIVSNSQYYSKMTVKLINLD